MPTVVEERTRIRARLVVTEDGVGRLYYSDEVKLKLGKGWLRLDSKDWEWNKMSLQKRLDMTYKIFDVDLVGMSVDSFPGKVSWKLANPPNFEEVV